MNHKEFKPDQPFFIASLFIPSFIVLFEILWLMWRGNFMLRVVLSIGLFLPIYIVAMLFFAYWYRARITISDEIIEGPFQMGRWREKIVKSNIQLLEDKTVGFRVLVVRDKHSEKQISIPSFAFKPSTIDKIKQLLQPE